VVRASKRTGTEVALLVLIGAIVVVSALWGVARYRECREFGHSVWYCIGR
jgi:hypothetical protein